MTKKESAYQRAGEIRPVAVPRTSGHWRTVPPSMAVLIAAAGIGATALLAQQGGESLRQSEGANAPRDIDRWRADESRGGLEPYPDHPAGALNPAGGVWRFGGSGTNSYSSPVLPVPFAGWAARLRRNRAEVDCAARAELESRYDLGCRQTAAVSMSRGKPQPIGPAAKLPEGVASWEDYAEMSADRIRGAGPFPYRPLDHPIHSTAHMLFPPAWTRVHPEHERLDAGFDIPDCFLPESPPALYLTTHKEMGDVTRGVEITYSNYFNLFNGLLTPEQMEGLRLLVTPFQTTWFNITHHRVTAEPSQGVACFSCHVNGQQTGRSNWPRTAGQTTRACAWILPPCAVTTRS